MLMVSSLMVSSCLATGNVYYDCRADIKQYIGMPSVTSIYKIYLACLKELTRVS